jgi:hypothetical protein
MIFPSRAELQRADTRAEDDPRALNGYNDDVAQPLVKVVAAACPREPAFIRYHVKGPQASLSVGARYSARI